MKENEKSTLKTVILTKFSKLIKINGLHTIECVKKIFVKRCIKR